MIAIEVNGNRVEVKNEKEARKALAKAVRAERNASEDRSRLYRAATMKAESAAYRVLARKASGEEFPQGWTFYGPTDEWSKHLFQPVNRPWVHTINAEDKHGIELDHYGLELLGAVCNGSGFCWLVFLRDGTQATCFAIGVEGEQIALAECPGIGFCDFRSASKSESAVA